MATSCGDRRWFAVALLGVAGCSGALRGLPTPAEPPPEESPIPAAVAPLRPLTSAPEVVADRCPVDARGVHVRVADTPHGAALVFETTQDPSGLRTQVFAVADVHNALGARLDRVGRSPAHREVEDASPRGRAATDAQTRDRDVDAATMGIVVLTPSHAYVDSVDAGVRIEYVADDPIDAQELRVELRVVADAIEDACAWGRDAGGVDPPAA